MSETQLLFVKQSAANSENKKVHIIRSAAYWHLDTSGKKNIDIFFKIIVLSPYALLIYY